MNVRLAAMILLLAVLARLIASCGDANESPLDKREGSNPPNTSDPAAANDPSMNNGLGIPLAPALTIPEDIDAFLDLPEDEEPISFNYTEIALVTKLGNRIELEVLVADTIDRRRRGLMYRRELPPNRGMLFAFPVATTTPFWNQRTPQNLDIAFLGLDGTIQEILTLSALETVFTYAEEPYHYAVEVQLGWFIRNAAGPGDRFEIPDSVLGLPE